MIRSFPRNFVFGAATAAFQVEGATKTAGRVPCCWDEYLARPESLFDGDTASDFYHTYKEDLELCKKFGIHGIRISLAWTRIIADEKGTVNPQGIAFYNDLIDTCLANDIEPFVTLHHFDTPLPLFKKGDWLNRETITQFVQYAKVCFQHFGDRVKNWITINEPYSVAAGQYIVGHFPPNVQYKVSQAVQSMHHMMVAHSKVVQLYKSMQFDGEIGIVHLLEGKYPIEPTSENKKAADLEDTLANQFLLDATLAGGYRKDTVAKINQVLAHEGVAFMATMEDLAVIREASSQNDFLGVNYYASHFVEAYQGESKIVYNGTGKKGTSSFALKGVGKRVNKCDVPTTDWDWSIFPSGLYDMLLRIKKEYPNYKKLYITENGIGAKETLVNDTVEDDARIDYVGQHLDAVLDAIDEGVNVQGYFLWSLMDAFSWTNGFNKRYGFFYVDFATQKRYPKKSAYWYKNLAEKRIMLTANAIHIKGVE